MSWENILKGENPSRFEMEIIIQTHTTLSENWGLLALFINDLKELKKLMKISQEDAQSKWEEMKGERLDIEGTFETVKKMYAYIDRLLEEA